MLKRKWEIQVPLKDTDDYWTLCTCTTTEAVQAIVSSLLRAEYSCPPSIKILVSYLDSAER